MGILPVCPDAEFNSSSLDLSSYTGLATVLKLFLLKLVKFPLLLPILFDLFYTFNVHEHFLLAKPSDLTRVDRFFNEGNHLFFVLLSALLRRCLPFESGV